MSFTSAAACVAALFICASGAEITCPNASCPAQWDTQPNENVDEDTRSIEDELAMIQVSIRQHKDGLPSESATLEHGQTLKMTALNTYWPQKVLTESGSNFVRPADYVPPALQKFCTDYVKALLSEKKKDNDAKDWRGLWSENKTNLEMHPAFGEPVLGWEAILKMTWLPKGVTSAVLEKVWPTVDPYKVGFEMTFKHALVPSGKSFTVFDVVELDTDYKMKKLKVYSLLAGMAARPEQTKFCTTVMNAALKAKNDNSSTWLDLWSRANDSKLIWDFPVGAPVHTGYANIQSAAKHLHAFQSGTLLNAFPSVNPEKLCCTAQFTVPGGKAIEILEEVYFDTSLLASTLQESSSFNHTAGTSPAYIPP